LHAKQIKTENRVVSKTIVIIYKGVKLEKNRLFAQALRQANSGNKTKRISLKKKFQVEHSAAKKLKNKTS